MIQKAMPAMILLLCHTPASTQGVPNMNGYLKLIFVEDNVMLYRNNSLDFYNITKSIGDSSNEILFSNVSKDLIDKVAPLKSSFRIHGYNAFWLDDDRCFFVDNRGNKKVVQISSRSINACDIDHEAHKANEFPQDGNFLGRSGRVVFWSQSSMLFWRNAETGAVDSVTCPKYVKILIGAIGMPDGKVAIFASGKNPSFFGGHPGWSGVLSFDFASRAFKRLE